MAPKDSTGPFESLGYRSYPQFAIVDIDHHRISSADAQFTAHQGRYHQFATFNDFDPLRLHSAVLLILT